METTFAFIKNEKEVGTADKGTTSPYFSTNRLDVIYLNTENGVIGGHAVRM